MEGGECRRCDADVWHEERVDVGGGERGGVIVVRVRFKVDVAQFLQLDHTQNSVTDLSSKQT